MDLDTLRGFFRLSPFMVDLGVEPVAVADGRVSTVLAIAAITPACTWPVC
jgi:hypothetical protein